MILLAMFFFGLWNAFVVKDLNDKTDTTARDNWHRIGVVNKLLLAAIGLVGFLPPEYFYLINPFVLFPRWYGIILSSIVFLLLCYWLYNMIINRVNNLKLIYLSKGNYGDMFYVGSFFIVLLSFVATILLYIDNYF